MQLLKTLQQHRLPFLVGGAYGFVQFTGIRRPTKDLDIFVRQSDWDRLAQIAAACGHRAELAYPHWLGKIHDDSGYVDVIFNSGNGLSPVDDSWFAHAPDAQVLGLAVKLIPVEEKIWTKAFVMERERYDGADVAHLIHACAPRLDWARLLQRFGPHWRVLLSHLVLFGFIYPSDRSLVPKGLMDDLMQRLRAETHGEAPTSEHCAGTLLSREQYLPDVAHKGYEDVRVAPGGPMTPEEVADWTAAITPSTTPDGIQD
ncbi:MAG TPA: nucleotidyltransferase [Burkholderiaceae bacterium]